MSANKIKFTVEFDELGVPTISTNGLKRLSNEDIHSIGLLLEGLSRKSNLQKYINEEKQSKFYRLKKLIKCFKYAASPATVDYR